MTRTATVITAHEDDGSSDLTILPGEMVVVGERGDDDDGAYPEFVPITTGKGEAGWVPARVLSEHRPDAVVAEEYRTRELFAAAGDVLDVLSDDDGGWTLCRSATGDQGWIPTENLG